MRDAGWRTAVFKSHAAAGDLARYLGVQALITVSIGIEGDTAMALEYYEHLIEDWAYCDELAMPLVQRARLGIGRLTLEH